MSLSAAGTAPLAELVDWADGQCHAIATSTAETLATQMWRIRVSLEARLRREPDPNAARPLTERLVALQAAEDDLASVAAILRTMGGPITWRDAADHIGPPSP